MSTAVERPGPTRRTEWWARGAVLALGALYVVLASQVPISLWVTAMHDDALFISRGMQLADGHWLGPYNELTLAKGPTYSIFLALNSFAGTSVLVSTALLHLLGSWLVTREVERLGLSRWVALAMFTVILFHPALFPTRVLRDNIYAALTLIALAGALRVCWRTSTRWTYVVAAAGGVAVGLLWATREEGVWVLPGLLLLVVVGAVAARQARERRRFATAAGAYLASAGLVVGSVVVANQVVYDTAVVTDFASGPFADAVTELTSIEAGQPVARIPVSSQMRREAYQVSPAFAELEETLEAPDNRWRGIGCQQPCDDFAGGWWIWALREAAASQGHHEDADAAAAYYARVAGEVAAACDDGRLSCRTSTVPFMPHLTQAQWRQVPSRLVLAVKVLVLHGGTVPGAGPSTEPLALLEDSRSFLGHPPTVPAPAEGRLVVSGWYHDPNGAWLRLTCPTADGGQRRAPVARADSPDVAGLFGPSGSRNRFAINLDLDSTCSLDVTGGAAAAVQVASLAEDGPRAHVLGTGTLQVEGASATPVDAPPTWGRAVVDRLAVGYGWFLPLLLGAGLLGLLVGAVRSVRSPGPARALTVVALACWCLVATRCVVLVLVDVTSFDAVHAGYMSAAFPLAVVAAFAGLAAAAAGMRPRRATADQRGA